MYAELTRNKVLEVDIKRSTITDSCTLYTDGFRADNLQVLNPGEVYFLGSPKALGVVMERKPLTVENTMGAIVGQSWRGWYVNDVAKAA